MLPTCPACKQSVLDDDAEECPFCGANMKTGKAGKAKPSAAAPAKPAPKSAAPASKGPSSPSKSPSSSSKPSSARKSSSFDDDDDDPFSEPEDDPFTAAAKEEAANKANAIVVSPKKGKTSTVEIKCPMCESVGFVPETAAGKDVKCYNPKCSMPNFMAPKRFAAPVPTVAVPAKKEKKSNSKMPVILALLGGIALVGVVALVMLYMPEGGKDPGPPKFPPLAGNDPTRSGGETSSQETDPKAPTTSTDAKSPENPVALAPAGPDLAELLNRMALLSLEEAIDQNKLKCRRLAATGYALTNDVAGMEEQFKSLEKLDAKQPSLKMPAWLALAWTQLEAGDKAGASKSVDQALAVTGNSSRETQEPVMDLASLLVALGREKEAQQLLATKLPVDENTPLAVLLAVSRHRRDYDLTQELPGSTPQTNRAWSKLGVTLILAGHGLWAESRQWAEGVSDIEGKTDCLLAWADAKTRVGLAKKAPNDATVEEVAASLTPGGKVELLGRLALTHAVAGNKSEADRLIAAGQEALKAIPVPSAVRLETFKETLDWKPPQALPLRQAVLGAALIGQAQARQNQLDAGWITTLDALKLARAIAPSPDAVAAVKRNADDFGVANLRLEIRKLLSLRGVEEAVKKTSDLLENLRNLNAEAASRYHLQEAVLIGAVDAGMGSLVWTEVHSLSQRSDPNDREPFAFGPLANHLMYQLEKGGKQAELAEINAKLQDVEIPADDALTLRKLVEGALTPEKYHEIIGFANRTKQLSPEAEAIILRSFIAAAKVPDLGPKTLNFVGEIDLKSSSSLNMVKLEGFRMTAAYIARQGRANDAHILTRNQVLTPLEKIAGFLGVIEGETYRRRNQPAPTPTTAPADTATKPAA